MEMVKVRTCDLIGAALDWAVAKAVDYKPSLIDDEPGPSYWACQWRGGGMIEVGENGFSPSTDWSDCGPLIKGHAIGFVVLHSESVVAFPFYGSGEVMHSGPTHLIAACRAIVSAHLGDSLDVPAELVGGGV